MQTIKGLENLVKATEKIGKVREAFANELVARVQERTPVRTGLLKDSWVLDLTKRGKINLSNTATNEEGEYYVAYVEYGTMHFHGFFMLSATVVEAPDILAVAKSKVGL